jgi:MinD superfamily P-loop ATPase
VVEAVRDADHVVLVGEPTRFGLHDLDLMVQTLIQLSKPLSVIVNKAVDGNHDIEAYCAARGIDVISRIPWRRDIAHDTARGLLVAETVPDVRAAFESILETVLSRAAEVAT